MRKTGVCVLLVDSLDCVISDFVETDYLKTFTHKYEF
jgi:hypothetical protein